MYRLSYKSSVAKDLRRLDKAETRRVLDGIESRILENPLSGKALKGDFRGCFRYRFGDYRVIYTLNKQDVLILKIGHRKEVYQ